MTTLGLWRNAFEWKEMRLVGGVTVGVAVALAWLAPSLMAWLPALLGAVIGWAASEYVLHRYVLHMPRPMQITLRRFHARLHWKHHQDPDKPHLLFVPLAADVSLFLLFGSVGAAFGGVPAALGAALGLGLALLHYETTHLAAHVAYIPRTRWGRFLKRFHRLHHYKNEHYWFGVTHPFIDMLVGTWPDHHSVEKSSTARTLGIEPEGA
ncbi:MAG: sterol desaturase family protein [Polyangiales bacterium]